MSISHEKLGNLGIHGDRND